MEPLLRLLACLGCAAVVAAACSGGGSADPELEGEAASPSVEESVVESVEPTPTPVPTPENAIKVGVLLDVGSLDADNFDAGNVMSPLDRQPSVSFEAGIDRLNGSGGVLGRPVSLSQVDTTSRLSVIDKAARDMIDDGVVLLVVTCEFDFARPAIERADAAGVLVISPCASEQGWATGDAGELAFSMVPSADRYGVAMADYAWAEGYRNIALLTDSTAPEAAAECRAFADRWTDLGGMFSFRESFGLRSAELLDENPNVAGILAGEAAVLCAFPTIGLELIIGVRRIGAESTIIASPSLDSGTWLPIDIAEISDGAADIGDFRLFAMSSVWGDDPSARVAEAVDGYVANQATLPSSGRFVLGADLADLWATAVDEAGTTDGAAVAEVLRGLRDVETVSGTISFAGRQAPAERQLRVLRHRNGNLVFEQLVGA